MIKKSIIFLILFSASSGLFSEVFTPKYYLPGYTPLNFTELDYYKLDKGFSLSEFARPQLGSNYTTTTKEIDYEKGNVKLTCKLGNIELTEPVYVPLESYYENSFNELFHRTLDEKVSELLRNEERTDDLGLIPEIVIELPKVALPRAVRKFMGNKAGRLSLDGSQRLTFAGNSTKRSGEGTESNDNQDFDLDMTQDLNLRLRGTIGEKIHVNVNHQSTSDSDALPTPTEVNINYEGDEDEIVKRIDGGNISLALSGSQFISYNVSSEGLFGIKTDLEAGNLKVTAIMGKDEAKKNTQKYRGSSQADSTIIASKNYVKRRMYFIEQPDLLYELVEDSPIFGYNNNQIEIEDGKWKISAQGAGLLPDPEKPFALYIDDNNVNNNGTVTVPGYEIGDETTQYQFNVLTEGLEFTIDYNSGLITFFPEYMDFISQITRLHTIGVSYTTRSGLQIGDSSTNPVLVKILKRSNQTVADPEWKYEVRNIYSLGMQGIKSEGFELNIFTRDSYNTPNFNLPDSLLQLVPEVFQDDVKLLNGYLLLDVNKDGLINGDDSTVNLEAGYIIFPLLEPFYALGDSAVYLEDQETVQNVGEEKEYNYYFSVKGEIGRDQISLGQMNILPGSVVVKLGSSKRKLTENVDFIVDYDFGIINFLNSEAKNPDVEIDISYQFKPLFSVDSKTILGVRADMEFNQNIKAGGTLIYQSEKVKEDRPKIGNENRNLILADIDGELDYDIPFMTRFIDWFPLIKTDEESTMNLSGEVAMSIPTIYGSEKQHDKKEAYIDDMESILDTYPLGVSRVTWAPASRPFGYPGANPTNLVKANLNYYNPQNVYAEDVYDPETLSNEEEREKVPILAFKIKPPPLGLPGVQIKYWAGVMKYIGNQVDFSNKKYIEFLVKVDNLNNNTDFNPVNIHIDLGEVSEDFYRPGESDKPDKEDGQLNEAGNMTNVDGILDGGEDTGLDRIKNGEPGDDPFDNYDNKKVVINGDDEYPYVNGTEGNDKLDTEDLNSSSILNLSEVYFEYSACINDGDEFLESQYNGWRLYRIPLHNRDNYTIVSNEANRNPDLERVSYARIWFETQDSTRIKLVSLDIAGNKWEEGFIREEDGSIINDEEETMLVGIIDNQKDQHYNPAPHTVIKKQGEDTLEQSLTIDYTNLGANHFGLVTQSFREYLNLTTYERLRLWVYGESAQLERTRSQSDTLIIRMGADSLNYYQIKHAFETASYQAIMDENYWEEIEIDFSDLTELKNIDADEDVSYTKDGFVYSKVGNPTLTNIRSISLGMKASETFTGRIYFDDLRVADPYEEIGFAARTTFHTKFADFSDLDVNLQWRTENFQASSTRTNSPSQVREINLSINNKYYLQKFLPAEWGLNLPLTLKRTQSLGIPRFKANTDVLRDDLSKEDKAREKNKSLTKRADISFSQSKTPKNKILAYTLKNTTINSYIEQRKTTSSTLADTTITFNIKHNYRLSVSKENTSLNLWKNYKFYYFPNSIENQLIYDDKMPSKWRWETYTDSIPFWTKQTNSKRTKSFNTLSSVNYDMFSDISAAYSLSTKRDLLLKNYVYDVNIGQEKERTQTASLNFTPKYLESVFSFDANASANYDEDHIKVGVTDTLYYKGSVTRDIGGTFTLKNRDMLEDLSGWINKKFGKKSTEEIIDDDEKSKGEEELNEEEKKEEDYTKTELSKMEDEFGKKNDKGWKDDLKGNDSGGKEEETKPLEGKQAGKYDPKGGDYKGSEGQNLKPIESSNIFGSIVGYIARIENIRVTYDNNYRTSYEERLDRPKFLYQLGLPHILQEDGVDKEIDMKTITDKISTSFGFPIFNNLSTNWGYSTEHKRTYSFNNNSQITTNFPNISITLSEFEKLIHFENILTSSRLTSSFVQSISETGEIGFGDDPDTKQVRLGFTPLLSWFGNWKGNITSNINLNHSITKNERNLSGGASSGSNSTVSSITGSFSWSYAAAKGLKILFFKRTRMKNELSTDLSFSVERTYNISTNSTGDVDEVENKIHYTVTPVVSYQFSKNISGGLTSNYEYTDNMKQRTKLRTFRLGIFVEILF